MSKNKKDEIQESVNRIDEQYKSEISQKNFPPASPALRRRRVQIHFNDPHLCQTQFADDANINTILDKYNRTGELPYGRRPEGQFMDLSELPDYREALEVITTANQAFATLPAELRKKLDNDPAKLQDFMSDPANADYLLEKGLFAAIRRPQIAPESDLKNNLPDPAPKGGQQAKPPVGEGPKA